MRKILSIILIVIISIIALTGCSPDISFTPDPQPTLPSITIDDVIAKHENIWGKDKIIPDGTLTDKPSLGLMIGDTFSDVQFSINHTDYKCKQASSNVVIIIDNKDNSVGFITFTEKADMNKAIKEGKVEEVEFNISSWKCYKIMIDNGETELFIAQQEPASGVKDTAVVEISGTNLEDVKTIVSSYKSSSGLYVNYDAIF